MGAVACYLAILTRALEESATFIRHHCRRWYVVPERQRVCCSMCGPYNHSAFTMHALSLSDGLFPCISLMRVMHRGLAMHQSNHLEMWTHVNPYKGRFNTLEIVSWELLCVLPQSMSGVQWTVAWSLWSVNRESSIFRAWQSRARADWRNTPLWDDISIMEAVCVISANRLGVV